jgi:hypothetical protein
VLAAAQSIVGEVGGNELWRLSADGMAVDTALNAQGPTTLATLDVQGPTTLGDVIITGNLTYNFPAPAPLVNLDLPGYLKVNGTTNLAGSLDVTGAVTASSTLNVAGVSSLARECSSS